MTDPRRRPSEASVGLFPCLTVTDNVQSGSICFDQTRLPVWAPLWRVQELDDYTQPGDPAEAWEEAANGLVFNLLQQRGEFARLLLVLADAERCQHHGGRRAWWDTQRHRARVGDQLKRCLAVLDPGLPDTQETP